MENTTRSSKCKIHGDYISKTKVVLGREMQTGCPECIKDLDRKGNEIKLPWISKRREGMTFDTYLISSEEQQRVYDRVKKYATNFKAVREKGICLTLVGTPGTGKTHLAISLGRLIVENGHSVSYERLYDLMQKIKDTYSKANPLSEAEIIDRLIEFDLLILDEVGLKTMTETESTLTYQIIDKRYEDMRPTVLVSNLNESELSGNLGSRTVDRLYENHGAIIEFTWGSNRRKVF